MELWVLLLLVVWVGVAVVFAGACCAAARGDAMLRESTRALRDAHWSRLQR